MNERSSLPVLRCAREVFPTEAGIKEGRSGLMESLERLGLPETTLFAIELCVHEALVNALLHGIWESGGQCISLSCEADDTRVAIAVEDDGGRSALVGGDPAPFGMTAPGGRGLRLIRALMTQVSQNRGGHGLTMSLDLKERTRRAH